LYPEGSDWFYGFDYRLDDRSLRDMIDGCRRRGLDANPPDPMAVAGPETSPEPEPPTATTALGGMTVIPNRTFGVGVGERPALATAGFEECQAICLVNSDCQAVIFTPASGLCRPWDELGSYEKAIGSVSALRP
jgi:hypothetical protein